MVEFKNNESYEIDRGRSSWELHLGVGEANDSSPPLT